MSQGRGYGPTYTKHPYLGLFYYVTHDCHSSSSCGSFSWTHVKNRNFFKFGCYLGFSDKQFTLHNIDFVAHTCKCDILTFRLMVGGQRSKVKIIVTLSSSNPCELICIEGFISKLLQLSISLFHFFPDYILLTLGYCHAVVSTNCLSCFRTMSYSTKCMLYP